MKLSDFKGEKAIEVFADLLEPVSEIVKDSEIRNMFEKENVSHIEVIKKLLKGHSKEVIKILAILEDKNPEEYEVNLVTLPKILLEILNDKDFMSLFTWQSPEE